MKYDNSAENPQMSQTCSLYMAILRRYVTHMSMLSKLCFDWTNLDPLVPATVYVLRFGILLGTNLSESVSAEVVSVW